MIALLLAGGATSLAAQSFRGEIHAQHRFEDASTYTTTLGSGEVLLLSFPADARFFAGLRVEIRTAQASAPPGTFTATVWSSVDADSTEGVATFAGQQIGTLPVVRPRQSMLIPTESGTALTADAGEFRTREINPSLGPVAVQLVPVMKGATDAALAIRYEISVSPVLRSVGGVVVELSGESELVRATRSELTLTLDDAPISLDEVIERTPGIYRLTATAGDYLDVTVNVGVDRGEIRTITLEPTEPRAQVRINLPNVAELYWNGALVQDTTPLTVAPGTHSLLIRLGDFTLTRQVTLEANQRYDIGLDLDILFNED